MTDIQPDEKRDNIIHLTSADIGRNRPDTQERTMRLLANFIYIILTSIIVII